VTGKKILFYCFMEKKKFFLSFLVELSFSLDRKVFQVLEGNFIWFQNNFFYLNGMSYFVYFQEWHEVGREDMEVRFGYFGGFVKIQQTIADWNKRMKPFICICRKFCIKESQIDALRLLPFQSLLQSLHIMGVPKGGLMEPGPPSEKLLHGNFRIMIFFGYLFKSWPFLMTF